uniref:Uncharacterized protein n=1 Tax=Oryza brachyantha TaxID=4533 RepID=J3L0J1_ORYBR
MASKIVGFAALFSSWWWWPPAASSATPCCSICETKSGEACVLTNEGQLLGVNLGQRQTGIKLRGSCGLERSRVLGDKREYQQFEINPGESIDEYFNRFEKIISNIRWRHLCLKIKGADVQENHSSSRDDSWLGTSHEPHMVCASVSLGFSNDLVLKQPR